jgi:hypothetical protein
MRSLKSLVVCALAGVSALALVAQQKPANIFQVEFQTIKFGMTKQYEDGRKAKAAWHKQMKDPRPLFVWQITTGDHTGTYVVAEPPVRWKDLDNPPISEDADQAEWMKTMGPAVESMEARDYAVLTDVSRPSGGAMPSKYAEAITFRVKSGKTDEFMADVKKITEAIKKTNWPANFTWYALLHGGMGNTFVLLIEHNSYADFEEPAKTFDMMLAEALGKDEAKTLQNRLDAVMESSESQFVKFRQDLSYIPAM